MIGKKICESPNLSNECKQRIEKIRPETFGQLKRMDGIRPATLAYVAETYCEEFSDKYLEILKGELAGINLTRITDEDEFYHKQILDSVIPFEGSEVFQQAVKECGRVVDIGFGGGFPILPLAHKLPDVNFLGMEARERRPQP